jgi:hypothetical protein
MASNYIAGHLPSARGAKKSADRNLRSPDGYHRQYPGKKGTLLRGEDSILELISMGAPLPGVLNKLCAAIDLQIGNVVSVILPADDQEHDLHSITRSALQFGLHVFWSASIPFAE